MSAVERVKRMVLWRASQVAAKGHQGLGQPEVEAVGQLPIEFRELLAEVVEVGVQGVGGEGWGVSTLR